MNRVALSFNFNVPETLIIEDGAIKRWYYSNSIGQVKLHDKENNNWTQIVQNRVDDVKGPSLVTFKLSPEDDLENEEQKLNLKSPCISKDILSGRRTETFARYVESHGFPRETHMVQQMLQAANLKQAITNLTPGIPPVPNVAPNHELFEVTWKASSASSQTCDLTIYRVRNLLKKSRFHIATSKGQMNTQIKPIRLKHGTVNPARALLPKLNVPQQLCYLSHEEDHNFAERQ